MAVETIQVPDLGDASDVEVIEVLVNAGDSISENDSIVVLETDKAAMEIPAPKSGTIKEMLVKVGDTVSMGDALLKLDAEGSAETSSTPAEEEKTVEMVAEVEQVAEKNEPVVETEPATSKVSTLEVAIPDLGDAGEVEVIDMR